MVCLRSWMTMGIGVLLGTCQVLRYLPKRCSPNACGWFGFRRLKSLFSNPQLAFAALSLLQCGLNDFKFQVRKDDILQ